MAYSYYYIEMHPIKRVKKLYSLEQAQEAHRLMWTWKSENPHRLLEHWPGFQSNGGEWPIGFMYKFTCDLTKDKLGVRRCSECPYKWIDRQTNKALGRWSPWHWCDYPGALLNEYHKALEAENFEKAKEVALEIANLTLSPAYAAGAVVTVDRPTYEELCDRVDRLENSASTEAVQRITEKVENELEPKVQDNTERLGKIEPRVDVIEAAEDQMEFMREARRNVTSGT